MSIFKQLAVVTLLCLLHISNLSVDGLCCHGFCTCPAPSGRAWSHHNCVAKSAVPKLSLFLDKKPCLASPTITIVVSITAYQTIHPTSSTTTHPPTASYLQYASSPLCSSCLSYFHSQPVCFVPEVKIYRHPCGRKSTSLFNMHLFEFYCSCQ